MCKKPRSRVPCSRWVEHRIRNTHGGKATDVCADLHPNVKQLEYYVVSFVTGSLEPFSRSKYQLMTYRVHHLCILRLSKRLVQCKNTRTISSHNTHVSCINSTGGRAVCAKIFPPSIGFVSPLHVISSTTTAGKPGPPPCLSGS